MKFQSLKQGFLLYGVVGLLVGSGVAGRAAYLHQKQASPFGSFSSAQIIARSTTICRVLAPQVANLKVAAHPFNAKTPTQANRRLWIVDASDEQDSYAAFLIWDADTGELLTANHPAPETAANQQRLSQRKALWMARTWMQELGVTPRPSRWKIEASPQQTGNIWYTSWRSGGRTAVIVVDAHSGNLIRADMELRRLPASALARSL